ncbi:hypothetical protein BDK61_0744 [Haloarcula quadrata]|uniref:Uncharacterized protein n=1 Tax=Haloarcula quadrata TaxID=182779 RepID=A0A495R3K1_9EURY|nr:hypothetical protein [Haloarcula quadrata]RKS81458.1 hypothetical protein BDK61_0744 [Haloarcula quadrata]
MTDGEDESEADMNQSEDSNPVEDDSEPTDTTEIPESVSAIAAFNSIENSGTFSALQPIESLNDSSRFSVLNQMSTLEYSEIFSALGAMDSLNNSGLISTMNRISSFRNPVTNSTMASLNSLDSSISSTLRAMSELDTLQYPVIGQLGSELFSTISAIGKLDSAVYPTGQLDSTLFSTMSAIDSLETTLLPTILAASKFDASIFSGFNAIDNVGNGVQTGLIISPEASGAVGTSSQSSVSPANDIQEPFEDSNTAASEIEDYLYEVRTQITFQRTYQALERYGDKIDRNTLLFIAFQLLNSMPVFIAGSGGAAATVAGSILGIIVFERTRD